VEEIGSGSCLRAEFDINDVEPSGSVTAAFVVFLLAGSCRVILKFTNYASFLFLLGLLI
jgi:hypothetical protein